MHNELQTKTRILTQRIFENRKYTTIPGKEIHIYFISNIKYNFDDKSQKDNKVVSELKIYQINNIQQLTQIIKNNFNKIN